MLTALAGVALLCGTARDIRAAESGPFSAVLGNWEGPGDIKKSDGSSERIRCRSSYTGAGANGLKLRLRCASDAYNFDLGASVTLRAGAFSGDWSEASRQVSGTITGHSANNGREITAVAQSITFNANLTLATKDNHQAITILSPGSEVSEVTIALDKK